MSHYPTTAELAAFRQAIATSHRLPPLPAGTVHHRAPRYRGAWKPDSYGYAYSIGAEDGEPIALMGAAEGPESEPAGAEIIGAGATLATRAPAGAWYAYAIRQAGILRAAAYLITYPLPGNGEPGTGEPYSYQTHPAGGRAHAGECVAGCPAGWSRT